MNINLNDGFTNPVHNESPKRNKMFIDASRAVGVCVLADILGGELINSNFPECVIWITDCFSIKPLSTIEYPIRYLDPHEEIIKLIN